MKSLELILAERRGLVVLCPPVDVLSVLPTLVVSGSTILWGDGKVLSDTALQPKARLPLLRLTVTLKIRRNATIVGLTRVVQRAPTARMQNTAAVAGIRFLHSGILFATLCHLQYRSFLAI